MKNVVKKEDKQMKKWWQVNIFSFFSDWNITGYNFLQQVHSVCNKPVIGLRQFMLSLIEFPSVYSNMFQTSLAKNVFLLFFNVMFVMFSPPVDSALKTHRQSSIENENGFEGYRKWVGGC